MRTIVLLLKVIANFLVNIVESFFFADKKESASIFESGYNPYEVGKTIVIVFLGLSLLLYTHEPSEQKVPIISQNQKQNISKDNKDDKDKEKE